MKYCCAFGCKNGGTKDARERGVSFHRFPRASALRAQWLAKVKRINPETGKDWEPGNHAVLCSEHFSQDDYFYRWAQKLLKPHAVPSVFVHTLPVKKRKPPRPRLGTASCTGSILQEQPIEAVMLEELHDPELSNQQRGKKRKRSARSEEAVTHKESVSRETAAQPVIQECSLSHRQFVSQIHSYSLKSPRKMRKTIDMLVTQLNIKNRVIKNTKRREKRLRGKVKDLMQTLRQQQLLTTQAEELLQAYKEIPLHLFKGKGVNAYTEEQRAFATTLHYYSPAAYTYVRKHLKLPHARTIRRWLSKYNGFPGLTQHSFDTIKRNIDSSSGWAYKLCCLHLDEMDIKKHIDYDRHTGKVFGFTDIGNGPMDDPSHPQATKVLAVIAVGLLGHWKLPLGYFLTDGTNAELQCSIIQTVISQLWESGCLAVSVTFDGLAANLKTVALLGGTLDVNNMQSRFPHPVLSEFYVCIIIDACHMVKLIRNLFREYKIINIPGVGRAVWHHIELLHKKQEEEGLTLGNKISKRHLEYKLQKMKVKLAVQVLSSSVANALQFLRINQYAGFEDTWPTEMFITVIDRLFDILNSRNIYCFGHKRGIDKRNAVNTVSVLNETRTFLLSLQDSAGKPLVDTKRRTCIVGFCATIDSLLYLIDTFVLNDNRVNDVNVKYLLTYRLSQDHVETFFSVIRRRGGWSNNPTAMQFMHAYRAVLSHLGVEPSPNANVTAMHTDEFMTAELMPDTQDSDFVVRQQAQSQNEFHAINELPVLTSFVVNICEYIAGFVVKKLLQKIQCDRCKVRLVALPEQVREMNMFSFLQMRDYGGLIKPSNDVVSVIRTAERHFRTLVSSNKPAHSISSLGFQLEHSVLNDVVECDLFAFSPHSMETGDGINNHEITLVRQIIRLYLQIRKFHILKIWNTAKSKNVRQHHTKMVTFCNA